MDSSCNATSVQLSSARCERAHLSKEVVVAHVEQEMALWRQRAERAEADLRYTLAEAAVVDATTHTTETHTRAQMKRVALSPHHLSL